MAYIDDLETEDKIYCYEGTKVLKNKLNMPLTSPMFC